MGADVLLPPYGINHFISLQWAARKGHLGLAPLFLKKEIDVGTRNLDFHAFIEYDLERMVCNSVKPSMSMI